MEKTRQRVKKAAKATWIGFAVNVILMVCKLAAGVLGRSGAMIADAVHSISDLGTDIAVLLGFKMVGKPPDETHNFGHGKFETLTSTIIGTILLVVGTGILLAGANKIIGFYLLGKPLETPGWIAFYAAIVSIAAKELLYQYTIRVGRAINSQAIIANAWHQRSDSLSSVGVMLGIGGAILFGEGWRVLDPIAAVVVSILIIKVGTEVIVKSTKDLLETSLNEEMKDHVLTVIKKVRGVKNPHGLKTRMLGNTIAIDVHVEVSTDLRITEAHDIASDVEKNLRKAFGDETFVSVHVDPEGQT